MAALIKHVLSKVPRRLYSAAAVPQAEITSTIDKIKARGFLRQVKDYKPPPDVDAKLDSVCSKVLSGKNYSSDYQISNPEVKFKLLHECFKEFNYGIPNSLLYDIKTVGDVYNFYKTPVDTTAPYDALKKQKDLPENLHLVPDYIRFHPDTDTMFKGKTAFPESSTIVSGLRERKKYRGFKLDSPFKDV